MKAAALRAMCVDLAAEEGSHGVTESAGVPAGPHRADRNAHSGPNVAPVGSPYAAPQGLGGRLGASSRSERELCVRSVEPER